MDLGRAVLRISVALAFCDLPLTPEEAINPFRLARLVPDNRFSCRGFRAGGKMLRVEPEVASFSGEGDGDTEDARATGALAAVHLLERHLLMRAADGGVQAEQLFSSRTK
jgi:hypothetical protein